MSETSPHSYLCRGCEAELNADANRITSRQGCDNCGRTRCFDKVKVHFTIVNENGEEMYRSKMVDWPDTPLLAINAILEDYEGPRGERVKCIDRIKVNRTPPLSEDEMFEREVQFEEVGLIVQDISLGVEK